MSLNRMSFFDTPNYKEALGFIVRVTPEYKDVSNQIIIKKGSLIYGFKNNNEVNAETYGFFVDDDYALNLPQNQQSSYILLSKDGIWQCIGNDRDKMIANLRGIGANVSGIPWYTYRLNGVDYALIGKVFANTSARVVTGFIVCDDPYWCEYESVG